MPQRLEFDLDIPITVEEFVGLSLTNCNHSEKEKSKFISDALQRVEVEHLRKRVFGSLSGGQRQRVILARALVHKPRILILDEPEAGIDREGEQALYETLRELARNEQVSIVVASHELDIVHSYADQVLCINKRLICAGPPAVALSSSAMEALYGANKARYHHDHTH